MTYEKKATLDIVPKVVLGMHVVPLGVRGLTSEFMADSPSAMARGLSSSSEEFSTCVSALPVSVDGLDALARLRAMQE